MTWLAHVLLCSPGKKALEQMSRIHLLWGSLVHYDHILLPGILLLRLKLSLLHLHHLLGVEHADVDLARQVVGREENVDVVGVEHMV